MEKLEIYRSYFNQAYPDYADSEYASISDVVSALPTKHEASEILESDSANKILNLIVPLVKIKNYKSQIPFPVNLYDAIKLIVDIKNTNPSENVSEKHVELFNSFIDIKGFQLPTVSAVFHFCHPGIYPIVDRNIAAACNLLQKKFTDEFDENDVTSLPAVTTSSKNKLSKYRTFIKFLTKLKRLHNEQHNTNYDFRELDKALMVYGVSNFKKAAENANIGVQGTA